jgi:hypothetical protein
VIIFEVVVTVPCEILFRNTSYPVTPMLSVAAAQVTVKPEIVTPEATRFAGGDGACLSGGAANAFISPKKKTNPLRSFRGHRHRTGNHEPAESVSLGPE